MVELTYIYIYRYTYLTRELVMRCPLCLVLEFRVLGLGSDGACSRAIPRRNWRQSGKRRAGNLPSIVSLPARVQFGKSHFVSLMKGRELGFWPAGNKPFFRYILDVHWFSSHGDGVVAERDTQRGILYAKTLCGNPAPRKVVPHATSYNIIQLSNSHS